MADKIDIEALLEAYRQRLRAQLEADTDDRERTEQAYRIHTMFQEPAMRYMCEVLNANADKQLDYVRAGMNLSVAFGTALATFLAHVPTEDQPTALDLMMNNIYLSTIRVMSASASAKPETQLSVEEFKRPVN